MLTKEHMRNRMFLLMVKHGSFSLPPGPGGDLMPRVNFKWPQNPRDLAEYFIYENELKDEPCIEIREALTEKIQNLDNGSEYGL